jgi:hypothetical protein
VPIPDYFGIYAVTTGGLVELKPNTTSKALGAEVEFVYYSKSANTAEGFRLLRTPDQNTRQVASKNDGKFKGWADFQKQTEEFSADNQAGISGIPRGSTQIELRAKSISGQPEIVRLIPANFLAPGIYQCGFLGEPTYRFSVSGNSSPVGSTSETDGSIFTKVESPSASVSTIVSPAGNLPTTGNKTTPVTPRSSFEKLTDTVPNANLFKNHTMEYSYDYEKVWDVVSKILIDQKENHIESDKDSGVISTDLTRHPTILLPYYTRYCVMVEKKNDNSTKITVKLLSYLANLIKNEGAVDYTPEDNWIINSRAKKFLDKIARQLQTGK